MEDPQFPRGKLNDDDEGALTLKIAYDPEKHVLIIDFGKPVAWIGLPRDIALHFVRMIAQHMGFKITIEF